MHHQCGRRADLAVRLSEPEHCCLWSHRGAGYDRTVQTRAALPVVLASAVTLLTVAACSGSSTGNGTPTLTPTETVTSTDTVTTSAPPPGTSGSAASTGPTSGSTGSRTTASGPVLCTPTVMTFTLGVNNGASGVQYFPVIATNASKQPCVTTGFPGVAVLNGSGGQYAQATRSLSVPGTTIVVQPGQKVQAIVGFRDAPETGVGQCPVSPGFLFTLPDNTDSTRLQRSQAVCSATVQAFVRYTGS